MVDEKWRLNLVYLVESGPETNKSFWYILLLINSFNFKKDGVMP